MSKLNIYHYDDFRGVLTNVETYFVSLNKEFEGIDVSIKLTQFEKISELKDDLKARYNKVDLLILDMYDKNSVRVGEDILSIIKNLNLKIPVVIYTQGSKDDNTINYNSLLEDYPFVLNYLIKGDRGEVLKEEIREHIIRNYMKSLFAFNKDDIFLRAQIMAIGKNNLNYILFNIRKEIGFSGVFQIIRMSTGFSGAAIFKLIHNNKASLLKISKDKKGLKDEIEKAKKYYDKFPTTLTYQINYYDEYGNDEVVAYLLKEVKDGDTLFDWLKSEKDKNKIEKLLYNLYFPNNKLATHYKTNRSDTEHVKFNRIFKTFDNSIKYSMVRKAINELKPIIKNKDSFKFNKCDIETLLASNRYKCINVEEITETKATVLCHGDFHSKNILVQGESPIIIDTGGLGYDYWTSDISRLIVHLYIEGIDAEKYEFFDLGRIPHNLEIAEKIINLKIIDLDGVNDSYINAINWLISHVEEIYDDLFSKWEFQLGLLKELLQISYRTRLPASKRSLALLTAYHCLIAANDVIKDTKK